MRIVMNVGDVAVELCDVEMTQRQIRDLLRQVADAANGGKFVPLESVEPDDDPEPTAPMGFTATVERSEEYHRPDFDWVYEE